MRMWILRRSGNRHFFFGGPHRFGAALQQKYPSVRVDGPLNILRTRVMAFDLTAEVSERCQFVVANARQTAHLLWRFNLLNAIATVRGRQMPDVLVRDFAY